MEASELDPRLLQAFIAVAEHRSFTRAAAGLHRTQSALSMQIKRLEDRLGSRLFHRQPGSVTLTEAGETLLGYAHRIVALSEEALHRLQQECDIEGTVRLGVMDDYAQIVLPPALQTFADTHPRVRIAIETGLTATMIDRLDSDFDLVVAMHSKGEGGGVLLREERPVWAASATHATENLDPLPVALYPQGCLIRQWAIDALNADGRRWNLSFVSQSLAAVESITAQGLAVTVVKAGTFPPRLRRLDKSDGLPTLPDADIRLHRAADLCRPAALLASHLMDVLAASPGCQ